MRKIVIFTLFLGLLMGFGAPVIDEEKIERVVKEEMATLEPSYLEYLERVLKPALQQGAGGDTKAPLVIPPIFEPGRQPDPKVPPRIQDLLEPVARSIVYAGMLCQGKGLDKDAEMDEVYVSFTSFSRTRNRLLKGFLLDKENPNQALQAELTTVTVQCSKFLQEICTKGACNSGKCGYSKALGAGCYHLCAEGYLQGIQTCSAEYYRGQIVPRFALGRVAGPQRAGQQNLYGQHPQNFLQQYSQPQQPAFGGQPMMPYQQGFAGGFPQTGFGQPNMYGGSQMGYGQPGMGGFGQPNRYGGQQGGWGGGVLPR